MLNQKSLPAPKLRPQNMQTAAYAKGFLRLTDANFFFFSKKTNLRQKSIKHPELATQKGAS